MNNKAFTLVELLAVIIILAIILAIAIPRISSIIESDERSSFVSSSKLLIKAVQSKLLEDNNFDITTINKSNIKTLLNIPDDSYDYVSFKYDTNGKVYINVKGRDKWDGLTTYGTYEYINIVNNENVVTDGLVMHLDAGNIDSYPGSGTTWTDLSGNGNNGTLLNGVVYDTTDGDNLYFDGANDYINIGNKDSLKFGYGDFTANIFIKFPNYIDTNKAFIQKRTNTSLGYEIHYNANSRIFGNAAFGFGGESNTLIELNKWYNICVLRNNGVTYLYINGTLDRYANNNIDASSENPFVIARDHVNGRFLNSNISVVQVYNRALSEAEIEQNFNSLRQRYGI